MMIESTTAIGSAILRGLIPRAAPLPQPITRKAVDLFFDTLKSVGDYLEVISD